MKYLFAVALWLALAAPQPSDAKEPKQAVASRQADTNITNEIVVPWPPGGGTDSVARAFADAVKQISGQEPTVINRPGASGSIGFAHAATPPAGSKLALISAEVLLLPLLQIGHIGLDDFIPVAQLTNDPLAITVSATAPWNTVEEFVAFARAHAQPVTISTAGVGTTHHMGVTALGQQIGAEITPVPYQGTMPAVQAVMTGEVQATIAAYAELAQFVQSGKLKTLAVLAPERLPNAPDIPTMQEKGWDLQFSIWRGLALAKDTPPALVNAWSHIATQVMQSPGFTQTLHNLSITPAYIPQAPFTQRLQQDLQTYQTLLPQLKMQKN